MRCYSTYNDADMDVAPWVWKMQWYRIQNGLCPICYISKTFNSCDDLSMPRTPLAGAANANESS